VTTKHTPGPWRVTTDTSCTDTSLVVKLKDGLGVTVCPGSLACLGDTEADAALIAAAPDLLAALEGLCRERLCHEGVEHHDDDCQHAMTMRGWKCTCGLHAARDAIKKARGAA